MAHLIRSLGVVSLLVLGVWLSAAGVVAAGQPDREKAPLPDPFTQAVCGPQIGDVTVSINPDNFRAYTTVFSLPNGTTKLQFTGFAEQIVQGNGKTLAFNVSGPGYILFGPNGEVVTDALLGHLFYIGPLGTPQPGLKLYTGHTVLAIDPNTGIATVTSFTGRVTDVCAMLA